MLPLGALLLGLGLWAGCAADAETRVGETVVARVGEGVITLDDVAEAYAEVVVRAGAPGGAGALNEVVEGLVSRQLLIEEARADGIEQTAEYRAARDLAETKALVDLYTATTLGDELAVTDADLRETFVQMNTTYEARHLYARDHATAEALRVRLLAGETFEALARETFADSALAASGGHLGAFGHDEMDPSFEAVAFRLPIGEVSEPVRTATGYSVIRVDARTTNPLLTEDAFATKIDQVRRYVRKRKRNDARFRLSRTVRDDLAPRFDEAAFDRLVAFATGVAPGLDAEALAQWRRTPLVRFDSDALAADAWTVADVEDRAATMTERQRAAVQDGASLRAFIEGLLVREELTARARGAGLDRDPRLARIVSDQMAEWTFEVAKRRLRLADDIPADSLRATIAAHPDLYRMPERVRAREILVRTRADADGLLARLRAGESFDALARAHSLRLGAATAGGDLGPVTRAQLGRMAEAVFAAAPGTVVGPTEVEGRYALIERGETLPSRPMTVAEAEPFAREALDIPFAQRRLVAAVARLRERFSIRVDRDALAPLLDAVSAARS
ncbi:MAG: peptidylprolyl isomerase [Rhodothermaceae bacterium]|nr:peptidylprolyl isomerase [Rhodothermaceae bacterium]